VSAAAAVVVLLTVGSYALKAAGPLLLGQRQLPPPVERVATLAPAALLAALVVTSGATSDGRIVLDARVPALGVAALLLARRAVRRGRARRRRNNRAGPRHRLVWATSYGNRWSLAPLPDDGAQCQWPRIQVESSVTTTSTASGPRRVCLTENLTTASVDSVRNPEPVIAEWWT
jgi:branched-subunit amino acid transport protein